MYSSYALVSLLTIKVAFWTATFSTFRLFSFNDNQSTNKNDKVIVWTAKLKKKKMPRVLVYSSQWDGFIYFTATFMKNWLVVLFCFSLYLLDPLPSLYPGVYCLFLLSFSVVLLLSLFQQGADTQGRGAQNQPGRTDRARDGGKERERESQGLWFCDSQQRESVPRGKGERGKRGREREREIRGKLHWSNGGEKLSQIDTSTQPIGPFRLLHRCTIHSQMEEFVQFYMHI